MTDAPKQFTKILHPEACVCAFRIHELKAALLEVREWLEDCSEMMYDPPRLKEYLNNIAMIDKALGEADDDD